MRRLYVKLSIISIFILIFSKPAFSGQISFDQLSVSADLSQTKYNTDLNTVFNDHNTNINAGNIVDDSLTEAEMADDINPRIRTYEGASCEYVDDGLLNTTTSGTLSGAIPTGTAYPRGYRCDKTSTTPRTWTASRWTFLDIDQNCDFQFTEVAIDASTPSVAANSIRISRVSTDGTEVTNVQDLRTTSCTSGSFDDIRDSSGEATLDDILVTGRMRDFRISQDEGWAQGLQISWDGATTTFSVLSGSAEVNGKFRRNTSTTSVPQTADNPSLGTSGLDTGAIAASTTYYVYGAADQDAVKTLSFSISANSSTPTGITNYRKIGQIKTDGSSNFISRDMLTYHTITLQETIGAWVYIFNSTASTVPVIGGAFNVSGIVDNGTGDYTILWDTDFDALNYAVVCTSEEPGGPNNPQCAIDTGTARSEALVRVKAQAAAAGSYVEAPTYLIAIGRKKSS